MILGLALGYFTTLGVVGRVLLVIPMSPPHENMQILSSGDEVAIALHTDQFCIQLQVYFSILGGLCVCVQLSFELAMSY